MHIEVLDQDPAIRIQALRESLFNPQPAKSRTEFRIVKLSSQDDRQQFAKRDWIKYLCRCEIGYVTKMLFKLFSFGLELRVRTLGSFLNRVLCFLQPSKVINRDDTGISSVTLRGAIYRGREAEPDSGRRPGLRSARPQ